LFFYRSLASLTAMQTNYNNFLSVSASLDNISTFESELKEGREADGISELSGFENGIQLKDIDFSYEDISVLRSIHLDIRKNTTVAFVGESGSGKTTLVNVITGLLPVSRGQVLVDDMPLSELKLQSYQKHIGYITQEAVIFNDTIFNNVTFWEEDTPENRDKFWRVLKQASIDGFVDQLPEKADSLLGHGGLNLSGGQRQRISIARELYKEADILILDEATSALDSQTEREIQENIELLQGQYTLLIVAHRLSTIKHADTIVLMENGTIKATGDFDQLVASNSQFKAMVELQTFENE
ncbi:MAG TPA: ATP-binding cassette domain-containing protein, partial [Aquaticitalea sp.]|nr:ATP-binding cassette domain-containing protein [Aquaticitalea sp.]